MPLEIMSALQADSRKRPFYKYVSPETALAVLESKNLRYSSPLSFNDPFDIQSGLHFEVDLSTLLDKYLDRLHELAAAPEEPVVNREDKWGQIVLLVRAGYPARGFPRQLFEQLFREQFNKLTGVYADTQRRYKEEWSNVLLPGIRVFCVSEDRDSLLMWAHYARNHTGCVFEFWALPDEDNPLSVAKAVEYAETPPPFLSEREWIDDLMGIKMLDKESLSRRYAYVKSKHWSYEREWRVWYPYSTSAGPHEDVPIRPSEFRALYIGCRASKRFSEDAVSLLRQSFPAARAYRAIKSEDKYALQYEEI